MMRASADFGHEEVEAQRIFIVGSGNIGLCLAGLLEARTPTVSIKIIERDRERAEQAAQALNRTMVLHGDALDSDILEEANGRKTDTLISLPDNQEPHIRVSTTAKQYGRTRTVDIMKKHTYNT